MNNNETGWQKPRTSWSGNVRGNHTCSSMPTWVTCTRCGKERFAMPPKEGEEYICHICRETDGASSASMPNVTSPQTPPKETEQVVSMRCLRHKKRFNVPKEWLKTSQWLCPHCYSVLDETDRAKYAPKGGTPPAVRPAEEGKPVVALTSAKIKAAQKTEKAECTPAAEPPPVSKVKSDTTVPEERKKKTIAEKKPSVQPSGSPSLASLMPRYRIQCQKCGQTVPCHYSWFDKSTVLCPECYGQMGPMSISLFHDTHKASKPAYARAYAPAPAIEKKVNVLRMNQAIDDKLKVLSSWPTSRIRTATKQELMEAVEHGWVSKARMRIELRRRKSSEYYDMCPNPGMERERPTSFE